MKNTCSKRFTHYYPSRPVSFLHIYSFSVSTLEYTVAIVVDNIRSGYYHPQYKLNYCQVPNLSPVWGEMRGQRNKPPITLY